MVAMGIIQCGEYCGCYGYSEPSHVSDIAEAVQVRLDAYKADKRDLGSVS